jgi:metacaspase-1
MQRLLALFIVVSTSIPQLCLAQSAVRGRALCVGLNEVDPNHYGSPLRLGGCCNDAQDLATILRGIDGFAAPTVLLNSAAKVAAVTAEINSAADDLKSGDIFVFTIASHGSQLPDLNGDEADLDSEDRLDETWLLHDRMWVDDERYPLWKKFKPGVRIVVVSDTCHAGTTIRARGGGSVQEMANTASFSREALAAASITPQAVENILRGSQSLASDDAFFGALLNARSRAEAFPIATRGQAITARGLGREIGDNTRAIGELTQKVRSLDRRDALALYAAWPAVYDPILKATKINERSPVDASVILLAACQDYQTAADGDLNGAFTGTVKEVWNSGFTGTYEEFLNNIKRQMYSRYYDQVPNYLTLGTPIDSFQHVAQRPFAVKP